MKANIKLILIAVFIVFAINTVCFAQATDPWETKITLNLDNAPLPDALSAILKPAGISYTIEQSACRVNVTANFKNVPVRIALPSIISSTGFKYKLDSGVVYIVEKQSEYGGGYSAAIRSKPELASVIRIDLAITATDSFGSKKPVVYKANPTLTIADGHCDKTYLISNSTSLFSSTNVSLVPTILPDNNISLTGTATFRWDKIVDKNRFTVFNPSVNIATSLKPGKLTEVARFTAKNEGHAYLFTVTATATVLPDKVYISPPTSSNFSYGMGGMSPSQPNE